MPSNSTLTAVPPAAEYDVEATMLAARREVSAGYRRALEILPPDHPERPYFLERARNAAVLAREAMLREAR